MLTRLTERDWDLVLDAFRAARSRRGDRGRDDRRFLEALRYFAVHNITWRALPAEFGNWNSIWKRFWRLSRTGTFEAVGRSASNPGPRRAEPDRASRADVRQHPHSRARLGGRRQGGQQGQALGRSRGGFGTKVHLKCDFEGLPLDFHLTGGEASDSRQFEILLDIGPDATPRAVMTDKGSDAQANRDAARRRGIRPVIPHRRNTKDPPHFFPKCLYRGRARIEQTIGRLGSVSA